VCCGFAGRYSFGCLFRSKNTRPFAQSTYCLQTGAPECPLKQLQLFFGMIGWHIDFIVPPHKNPDMRGLVSHSFPGLQAARVHSVCRHVSGLKPWGTNRGNLNLMDGKKIVVM